MQTELVKYLVKKARHGYRGPRIASFALYGPNDRTATRMDVALMDGPAAEPQIVRSWHASDDIRKDTDVLREIKLFLLENPVRTVVFPNIIVGCAHRQGEEYEADECPACTFWHGKDRLAALRNRTGKPQDSQD